MFLTALQTLPIVLDTVSGLQINNNYIVLFSELPDDLIRQLNKITTELKNMMDWKDEMMNKVDNIDDIDCIASMLYLVFITLKL